MSLADQKPWSWAALGLWLANASLALALAAGLLVGTQLADGAWDRGVHVTPAQTAMHAALVASGFANHHSHSALPPRGVPASKNQEPALRDNGAGTRWGTPLMQALGPHTPPCLAPTGCAILPPIQPELDRSPGPPLTPPPEVH